MKRGYFGIAVYHPKNHLNWGSLFRTANILGAKFLTTIGPRFKRHASDPLCSDKHIPTFNYQSFDEFKKNLPIDCKLVAIELTENAQFLDQYIHPERVVYLLGTEDYGIPKEILDQCHEVVKLRGERSMNLAVAGSIVLYHRGLK